LNDFAGYYRGNFIPDPHLLHRVREWNIDAVDEFQRYLNLDLGSDRPWKTMSRRDFHPFVTAKATGLITIIGRRLTPLSQNTRYHFALSILVSHDGQRPDHVI
jgi:hypothetical protein